MNKKSILIVEDHLVFGKALTTLLEEQWTIVGIVGSAEEALEQLPNLDVDMVLIDVSLPEMSGIQLVSEIQAKYPNILCLMLSGHLTVSYMERALEAGARGYILKDDGLKIRDAVQRVFDGEIYVSDMLRQP
jgi:DNA-binding NarL/FixJ family response regulator